LAGSLQASLLVYVLDINPYGASGSIIRSAAVADAFLGANFEKFYRATPLNEINTAQRDNTK
jgi:hypothetical protein